MITVRDIEEIRSGILTIFPDAIRGSVAKSNWGRGRKQLHLSYWIGSDTVGGLILEGRSDLFYLLEWDASGGKKYLFAENSVDKMIARMHYEYHGIYKITNTVC